MEREGQTKTDKGGGVSGFSKENNVTLQVIDDIFDSKLTHFSLGGR